MTSIVKGKNKIATFSELGIDFDSVYSITGMLYHSSGNSAYSLSFPLMDLNGNYSLGYGIGLLVESNTLYIVSGGTWSGYRVRLLIAHTN